MTNKEAIVILSAEFIKLYDENNEKYERFMEAFYLSIKALEFAEFTGKMLFDDWETDCNGVFPELACRHLCELGIVELKDGVYSLKLKRDDEKTEQEKPIGRWIPHEDWHSNLRYGCNICGSLTKEKYQRCPTCKSKMEDKNE